MNKSENDRITDLEIKVSYLEDFMNQLQEVCVEQTKEIELLKKENKIMIEKIKDLVELTGEEIPNRKPPHY